MCWVIGLPSWTGKLRAENELKAFSGGAAAAAKGAGLRLAGVPPYLQMAGL